MEVNIEESKPQLGSETDFKAAKEVFQKAMIESVKQASVILGHVRIRVMIRTYGSDHC